MCLSYVKFKPVCNSWCLIQKLSQSVTKKVLAQAKMYVE